MDDMIKLIVLSFLAVMAVIALMTASEMHNLAISFEEVKIDAHFTHRELDALLFIHGVEVINHGDERDNTRDDRRRVVEPTRSAPPIDDAGTTAQLRRRDMGSYDAGARSAYSGAGVRVTTRKDPRRRPRNFGSESLNGISF